jgi:very-short-patch-repair endonuclease
MDPWHEAYGFMRRQHGLISLRQLYHIGLDEWHARYRLERGEWRVARPGVYASEAMPQTLEQANLAVVLAVEGSLISHDSAGALWGFKGISPGVIEISAELSRQVRMEGVRGHRSCLLFDEDRSRYNRIPVTSRARTIVDLSGRLSAKELGPILDDQLRRGLILDSVRRCIGRLPPAPGRRPTVIHQLLAKRLKGYDPADSDLETKILRWLVTGGLPPPRQQFRVRIAGHKFRIDLSYPEAKVAIELDGWDTHRTRTAFDEDRARANLLVLDGWVILRFTSRSTADEVCQQVAAALARFVLSGAA